MAEAHEFETIVAPGLRALLEGIVDYAGTFPPACLALDEAVENYAGYRTSGDAWLLGRFVVPASRLPELDTHAALFERDPPFPFTILAGRSSETEAFVYSLESDLESAAAFRERHHDLVRLEAIEMRVPSELLRTDVVTVGRFISRVGDVVDRFDMKSSDLYLEIPLDQNCRQAATIFTGALSSFNRGRTLDEPGAAGLKMRTGGTEPESIPPAERVALLIAACMAADVPFKATAGLHHPVHHFDEEIGVPMHGFLNVFVAAVLAATGQADEADIVSILLDEDASAFVFSDEGVEWRGRRAVLNSVAKARRDGAVSFGSCSFTEPLDDLRALGLL